MLEWFKIENMNNDWTHRANIENGVKLPKLKEEVLFCGKRYFEESKDLYFSGWLNEDEHGCYVVWPRGDIDHNLNGLYWARFNRPFTENNKRFCIAYLDENGEGFNNKYPNIIECKPDEVISKCEELKSKGYSRITCFECIEPVTYDYEWDYIESHHIDSVQHQK